MMKTKLFIVVFLFSFLIHSEAQIEGKTFITSNCASGGFDYYFFKDGTVISECFGCEYQPYFQWGTYEIADNKVYLCMTEEWYGLGQGEVIMAASVNIYGKYAARFKQTNEKFDIPLNLFTDSKINGCEEVSEHDFELSDIYDFLRNDMVGKYPEFTYRLLTDNDLKNKTKKELRLMRNEIYARYGYIFSSPDLKAYFSKQNGYKEFSKDVEAWLSEIEKKNVKKIKAFELKK